MTPMLGCAIKKNDPRIRYGLSESVAAMVEVRAVSDYNQTINGMAEDRLDHFVQKLGVQPHCWNHDSDIGGIINRLPRAAGRVVYDVANDVGEDAYIT